jgi:BASS family bile acid:Na+ symporter
MDLMEFLNTRATPAVLMFVMFLLGLSLTLADFKRVVTFPKAVSVGLVAQLIGMPAVAFLLAYLLSPTPAIAVGLIILAVCPSGVTANAYSFAARADVALCVTLSALTSIITVFTIPFLTDIALQTYFEVSQRPELPISGMMRQLMTVTMLPILVGMTARHLVPQLASRAIEPMRKLALWLVMGVLTLGALSSWEVIRDNFAIAGFLVVTMNLVTMAMGYYAAKLAKLPPAQQVTITYEVGVQNLALAMVITLSILQRPDLAVAALLYAVVMPLTALGFLSVARRIMGPAAPAAAVREGTAG